MALQAPRFPAFPLTPAAYSILDPSALQAASQRVGGPIVGVIGDCKGGLPNTSLEIGNLGILKGTARSGPAYDTARAAFLGGAAKVKLIRVGTPTASSVALAGASGTPVTLTSLDKGAWTAGIKRTVQTNNVVSITFTEPDGQTITETWNVGAAATAQNVVDAINGKDPRFAASRYASASVTSGTMPLTAVTIAAFTTAGTDDGTIDAGDWTAGLKVLETQDVDLIVPATGDATVHAQVIAHCDAMSGVGARKERTQVLGGALGESVATVAARMTGTMLNKRVQLVYPGVALFNDAGALQTFDPYVAAGFVAGMHAALPDVATSLVGANLGSNVIDVEARLSTIPGGDVEQLLAANITPIGIDPAGGFQVIDSLSGWRGDYTFRDFHKIRTADYAAKILRQELEAEFKGRKMLGTFADEVKQKANLVMDRLVTQTILVAHADASTTVDPNNGTIIYVGAPIVLPDTSKYVLLTVGLTPASAIPTTT